MSQFAPNKTVVMSGGDDGTLRGWDLGTATQLFSSVVHSQQIRSGFVSAAAPDIWVTGGYDSKVHASDTRLQEVAYTFAVDDPVECVLSVDACLVAVANGPHVSLFDMRHPEQPVTVLSNHAKTVTCLDTSENGSKL